MIGKIVRALCLALAFFIMTHWLTAGHDNIIEGPPEIPEDAYYQTK